MKATKRKRYSDSFKKEAVRKVLEGNISSNKVSIQLGISQPTLSKWLRKYKQTGSSCFDQESSSVLRKLKAENKRLKEERDILKKAAIFFANHEG